MISNKRILIIDDSADIQGLLKILLESKGYTIECSSNGEEALRMLDSSEDLPGLILLDLRMPIMDGTTFLGLKRGTARLRNIPTVVMSGDEDIELRRIETNADDILKKPLNIRSLLEVLERWSRLH